MPLSPLHKKQRKKNFALLFLLITLVAIFFAVALVRMGH
jgi:hypothetical protein